MLKYGKIQGLEGFLQAATVCHIYSILSVRSGKKQLVLRETMFGQIYRKHER